MLKLVNVAKDYRMADSVVHALKNVNVSFRKSEFVSVLGPSGCGKTTLLNIIGGLDGYTSGDLVIDEKSTRDYTSRDWDSYRNHSVGFVFQSYNLIPHLNVLRNVELALTISGISGRKKRKLAQDALERVGLGAELKKKPNQLSGGQMQRVAIARAIVNNPEIILADEPTGALDSLTSLQVMDLLQEIADDRLVIMVTHNPDLAERYSTRIIRLSDGEIVSDSNPYDGLPTVLSPVQAMKSVADTENVPDDTALTADVAAESTPLQNGSSDKFVAVLSPEKPRKIKKRSGQPKEKKERTSMSFFTAVTLSAHNLVTKKTRTFLTAFAGSIGIIGIALVLSLSYGFQLYMADLERNTLAGFPITVSSVGLQINVDEAMQMPEYSEGQFPDTDYVVPYEPESGISGVKISANIITEKYVDYIKAMDRQLLSSVQYAHSAYMPLVREKNGVFASVSANRINWQELLWDDFMKSQYDVIAGGYPLSDEADAVLEKYDSDYDTYTETDKKARQAVLVVSSYNTIQNSILKELGFDLVYSGDNKYEPVDFDSIIGSSLKVIHNDNYFVAAELDGREIFPVNTDYGSYFDSDKNIKVTVVGVLRIKQGVMVPFLSNGVAYTEALTELYLRGCADSEIARSQKANNTYNVLTGKDFSEDLTPIIKMFNAYGIAESQVVAMIASYAETNFSSLGEEVIEELKACSTLQECVELFCDVTGMTFRQLTSVLALVVEQQIGVSAETVIALLDTAYVTALQNIGATDLPSAIYIYPESFESKTKVLEYLDAWNVGKSSTETVTYTDFAGSISQIATRIVSIVSYILIAFAAISLIVSSVMIGIITYVSVLERTTEIGVLRSIGARKIDVCNVFNAETGIIGLISGSLGVFLAFIIDFPLNAWIASLNPEFPTRFAVLNPIHALILIALSVVLTVVSGLIPAIIAAKKDPVKALRSNG